MVWNAEQRLQHPHPAPPKLGGSNYSLSSAQFEPLLTSINYHPVILPPGAKKTHNPRPPSQGAKALGLWFFFALGYCLRPQ